MFLLQVGGLLNNVLMSLATGHLSKPQQTVEKGCPHHFSLWLWHISPTVPKHIDGHLVLLLTAFFVCLSHYSKPVNSTNGISALGLVTLSYPLIVGSFPSHTQSLVSLNVWLLVPLQAFPKPFWPYTAGPCWLSLWGNIWSSQTHLSLRSVAIWSPGAPLQCSHTQAELPSCFFCTD